MGWYGGNVADRYGSFYLVEIKIRVSLEGYRNEADGFRTGQRVRNRGAVDMKSAMQGPHDRG